MYKVAFDKEAQKEFLKLDVKAQKLTSSKITDLPLAPLDPYNTKKLSNLCEGKKQYPINSSIVSLSPLLGTTRFKNLSHLGHLASGS